MSTAGLPVSVAVTRPDGSIEHVRIGTAVRDGDGFRLTFGELRIGDTPGSSSASGGRRASSAPPAAHGGMVFPPYGRSKGAPVAGASRQDLEYYAGGCRRTLDDPSKARWHDKERQLLAAIEAELARQGDGGGGGGRAEARDSRPPFQDDDAPPPLGDDDIPPPSSDDVPF